MLSLNLFSLNLYESNDLRLNVKYLVTAKLKSYGICHLTNFCEVYNNFLIP